jgi:phosphatidylglycerophosphatase A
MSLHAERISPAPDAAPMRKPVVSIFLATACGLGYLPKAPGTWGALGGLVVTLIPFALSAWASIQFGAAGFMTFYVSNHRVDLYLAMQIVVGVIIAALGVWTATRAARYWRADDPQKVVIDEVSGQHLAIVLGCALPVSRVVYPAWQTSIWGFLAHDSTLNWKYLLLGFILFRAFDIWKPFPARQAESLHGGWGIMADDWIAAIYAAIGLWIARAVGL